MKANRDKQILHKSIKRDTDWMLEQLRREKRELIWMLNILCKYHATFPGRM